MSTKYPRRVVYFKNKQQADSGRSRQRRCIRRWARSSHGVDVSQKSAEGRYSHEMSKQALGNVLAGVAFLIVAIVDFSRDSSGIGVVFLVFAAVFLGFGLSGKARQPRSSPQGD